MESHIKRIHVMLNEACHAELDSASLVQGRSRIKFGMTVAAGPGRRVSYGTEPCHAERSLSCGTVECHAELDSASLVQGRSRIKFGMTVAAAGPGWRWWQAGMTCVMPNEACHAERSNVMLNSIQHLLCRGDPESSSG